MRVLFLGGLGRSGTTLIERVLGELPGVVALGEVVHLWERSLLRDELCACGAPFSDCPFWTQVGALGFDGWDKVDPARVSWLRERVDRTRFIPRLARRTRSAAEAALLTEYLGYYLTVYAAAARISGAGVVIDSSKHPSLAFCLRAAGLDLRVVHCVRDSRAVAYSWTREVPRPEAVAEAELMTRYAPAKSALLWNSHNAAFALLRRLGAPSLRVRYEDFVAAPVATTRAIAAFAGLPVVDDALAFLTDSQAVLSPGHTTSGNPMRFRSGAVPIRPDQAWRQGLPAAQRRAVTALTLPLLARYHYLRAGTGEPT